eukprot:TRINITY_DN3935_c0_g1_i1.p1 TRINITY_DN3935_c0_g1~~TRINITY_DN3935_c0_g1_i1.p1  ORF type:complete len:231 (+),score=25.60 TRINITY_DN3935_c0_g1_i1:776-1468(+)
MVAHVARRVALCLAIFASICSAAPLERAGASLWAKWVAPERLSLWDNSAQVEREAEHPPANPSDCHPAVSQTRWNLDGLVTGGPAGWRFVMLEIGDTWQCAPESCEFTLFGLQTVNGQDTKLHSFTTAGNEHAQTAIKRLHSDPNTTAPVIDFNQVTLDSVQLVYKYGYNSTAGRVVFYGDGGGDVPGGGRLVVQETVAPTFVAPLELFYDQSGKCVTSYSSPLEYRRKK